MTGCGVTYGAVYKWDLSSVTLKRDSAAFEITQALTYSAPGGQPDPWPADVYALNDGDAGEGWGELTINYDNAPANLSGDPFNAGRTTYLGSFDFSPYNLLGHVYTFCSNGGREGSQMMLARKAILSFFCDDTTPFMGAKTLQTFLDYCAEYGIAGESSAVLGWGGQNMARNPNDEQRKFFEQVIRGWKCGIDTHMELMTHYGLFDFEANSSPKGAMCEGVWPYEPDITVEQYERYLGNIIAEGERVGIRFTGLTKPGCGCDACKPRFAELRAGGHTAPNPAFWKALLNLAKQGKFRGPTVPCFVASSETDYGIYCRAKDKENGVYELVPRGGDRFDVPDADYYITADGKSGIIVRSVEAGEPCCLWYCHWWTMNPADGVGWEAFRTVIERIRTHLKGRVIWMRPSDITDRYHKAGGWDFLDDL